ncbi:MAG: putative glycoside hydrolase [Candidatus Cloacimonadota bacterium]|nr:putative glycoside hydrolase [Candidatus Cloacimonadota bacterium]
MKKVIIFFTFLVLLISCENKKENILIDNESISVEQKIENKVTKIEKKPKQIPISKIPKYEISKNMTVRGIYMSAYTVASKKFIPLLEHAKKAKINSVKFELKNMNGHVFYKSPILAHYGSDKLKPIINIPSLVKTLHEQDMKAVSRVVMFHDMYLAVEDSTLCPKYASGYVWRESSRRAPSWLDPSDERNQKRLLGIIEEIARQGVDEIQLDYVRFPTGGKLSEAIFDFNLVDQDRAKDDSLYVSRHKYDIIKEFVKKAKSICDKYDVGLAADVFAIVSWQHHADVSNTGQKLSYMSQHLDFLHPMIYSSHFAKNFNFRDDVWNEPYDILFKGTKLTNIYSEKSCKIVPYIQANSWKVNYGKDYVNSQISAIIDAKGDGFILWNAQNNYNKILSWLSE